MSRVQRIVGAVHNLFPDRVDSFHLAAAGNGASGPLVDVDGNDWTVSGRIDSGPWTVQSGSVEVTGQSLEKALEQAFDAANVTRRPLPPPPSPVRPPTPPERTAWTTVQVRARDVQPGDVVMRDGHAWHVEGGAAFVDGEQVDVWDEAQHVTTTLFRHYWTTDPADTGDRVPRGQTTSTLYLNGTDLVTIQIAERQIPA